MPKELTWPKAIQKVLGASSTPLHYKEITEAIIAGSLRTTMGATPAATVYAHICASIKKRGHASPYVRTAKGIVTLSNMPKAKSKTDAASASTAADDEEEQYEIISSFGMFWQRDAIEWSSNPKLSGMQQIGAKPVDFSTQLGVYLLYDGREVLYVGRATKRPLGKRLYEHTVDRMSARWDRFSWFGLLPVSDAGSLGKLPTEFKADAMIPALEAILIEALEPRQNRKRGDDLAAVEYLQCDDPSIKKKQAKQILDTLVSKL